MIDMHSHALFGVDDGAQTIGDSIGMIEAAKAAGFDEIVLTPHYMPYGKWHAPMEVVGRNFEILKRVVDKLGLGVELHLGSEINYEYAVPEQICEGAYKNYGESCYFLLETECFGASAQKLISGIKKFSDMGFGTIIAHPERYDFVQEDVDVLNDFIKEGALIQSNFLSLTDYYRKPVRATMIKMLEDGLVHTMGTDAHQKDMYERFGEAARTGKAVVGAKKWKEITEDNPRRILKENERFAAQRAPKVTFSSSLRGGILE